MVEKDRTVLDRLIVNAGCSRSADYFVIGSGLIGSGECVNRKAEQGCGPGMALHDLVRVLRLCQRRSYGVWDERRRHKGSENN